MHEPNEALTGDTVPTRRPTRWRNAVEVLVVATTGFVVIPLAAAAVGYDPNLFLTTIEGFVSLLTLEAVVTLSLIWILLRWREQDLSLLSRIPRNWKTELVLCISLTVPLVRWLATALMPGWGETGGSYFAREFALYVNFSGVAIILWTGEAALSRTALAALLALIVLAELTLHADR